MIFTPTDIAGAWILEPEKFEDQRGFFARLWCDRELREQGLSGDIRQSNVGVSLRKGTLRGLHYQQAPYAEVKVVRCPRGAIFDVVVDLRPESASFTQWCGVELTEGNYRSLYVPEGCAQGYVTLTDNTEIYYHTSQSYQPDAATGVRYNDRAFGIEWPIEATVISGQDQTWPDFDPGRVGNRKGSP